MCDMKSTTVQGVTLYKSTIINTDPTYTQIWADNNFLFIREGTKLVKYRPWVLEHEGRELIFKIGNKEHKVLDFKTTEKILKDWNHRGIKYGKYFFIGKDVKLLTVS
jgi:hypothetical protein